MRDFKIGDRIKSKTGIVDKKNVGKKTRGIIVCMSPTGHTIGIKWDKKLPFGYDGRYGIKCESGYYWEAGPEEIELVSLKELCEEALRKLHE